MDTKELNEKAWNSLLTIQFRPAHENAKDIAGRLRDLGVSCAGLSTPATVILGGGVWRDSFNKLPMSIVDDTAFYAEHTEMIDDAWVAALIAHVDGIDRDTMIAMTGDRAKFWQVLQLRINRKYSMDTAYGIVANDLDPALLSSLGF